MKTLAIVGATGLVGQTVLKVLEERDLPIDKYIFLASKRSVGREILFQHTLYKIKELTEKSFKGVDYAIFVAGSDVSKKYIPIAVSDNCIVIDNSSAYRLEKNVPLVVPEVNPKDIFSHNGILANPNCSTIQSVIPLNVLKNNFGIKRVIYSTYQAVSGAGQKGIEDFENTSKGLEPQKFPVPIYNNCIPQIDTFLSNGYTKEEEKMVNETRKILDLPSLKITATAVRVPVLNSHCVSANVELERDFDVNEVIDLFNKQKGIVVKNNYPIPTEANRKDSVFIGRIRRDFSVENGLNFWVVADNLRKGAATNAVQILELLMEENERERVLYD